MQKLFGVLVWVETGSHVAWNGLELTIGPRINMNLLSLPPLPESWVDRHMPPHTVYEVLTMELKALFFWETIILPKLEPSHVQKPLKNLHK